MKVMIVGGGINSIWIQQFIKNVAIPLKWEIYLQKNPNEDNRYETFYKENNINFVFPYKLRKIIRKIPRINIFYDHYKRIRALRKDYLFDLIIVIYANPFYMKCAYKIMSRNSKVITWFIGSDLLRVSNEKIRRIKKIMRLTNTGTICVSERVKNEFVSKIDKNGPDAVIDFGNSKIEKINNLLNKNYEWKKSILGIDNNLITIAVGYNACQAQQHKEIINSIINIKNNLKKNIVIILPMTYHGSKEYIENIRNYLNSNNLNFIILSEFMDSDEMAKLWMSIDIFVHAQLTDAFSSSLLESIYAGCIVCNGSWLQYPELINWNVKLVEFNDFTELTKTLEKILSKPVQRNRIESRFIFEYASWESCQKKWMKLLEKY